jgi:hypothetical protein
MSREPDGYTMLYEYLTKSQTGDRYANYILQLLVVEIMRRHKTMPMELKWILARQPTLSHDDLSMVPK